MTAVRSSAGVAAWVMAFAVARAASAAAPVRIDIAFLDDGRCSVVAEGDGFRANLTYLPSPALSPASELRCTIPASPKGRPVDLTVRLPRGAASAGSDFPRLAWVERDGVWVGTASLPAAPAFVSVPQAGAAAPARWLDGFAPPTPSSPFGWNFYGWFVFAAAFIAAYLAWARWMARR